MSKFQKDDTPFEFGANDYRGDLKIRKIRMLSRELDHLLLDWRDWFAWGAEPME
jgi:hypothetical protein